MRNAQAALQRRLLDPAFLQFIIRYGVIAFSLLVALVIALTVTLTIVITHAPRVRYIYHDSLGKPRELVVTDQPYFTHAQVMNWAVDKVSGLYTLDFVHYTTQLNTSSAAFSTKAWNAWATSFKNSGNIEFIRKKRVFTTATPRAAPSILGEGPARDGSYIWRIRFPLLLKWENESGSKTDLLSVYVTIRRTNDPQHPDGLEISALSAPRASGGAK